MTVRPLDTTLDPSATVSPNIFDVLCNSTLIAPILLANLLSTDLWLLSEKIRSKYSPSKGALEAAPALIPTVEVGEEGLSKALREIQRQVDRGFKHIHPNEIAEIYGYLDIRTERSRLGAEQLNNTLAKVQQAFKDRATLGEQQATLTNVRYFDKLSASNQELMLRSSSSNWQIPYSTQCAMPIAPGMCQTAHPTFTLHDATPWPSGLRHN